MKAFKSTIFILFFGICLYGQEADMEGKVSYITSESIYVRFNTTEKINIGDSLYINNQACLVVVNKSSNSCVNKKINSCAIEVGTSVLYRVKSRSTITENIEKKDEEVITEQTENLEDAKPFEIKDKPKESSSRTNARISLATYSNLSPFEDDDRHRIIGRLSYNATRIKNSKFSFETYLNYRQNVFKEIKSTSVPNHMFRVYNLALTYDFNPSMKLSLGRKINRNLSSVGAIDGLQLEKQFNSIITGGIIGFRPDFENFGLNFNLLEYGFFIGHKINEPNLNSSITLSLLEQRNSGNTDRRYMNIQSVQNFNRKVNLYASTEIDLYSKIDEETSHQPKLTNIYAYLRYRFNRRLSATFSYDNRKRIIYYETDRTEIERLLEDDIARQGLRLRISYRPINRIYMGLSIARRFQSNDANLSNNLNAFVNFTKLPIKNSSLSLRFNANESNYLKTNIYSGTFSYYALKNKINAQLYFRGVNYNYYVTDRKLIQNYLGLNLYFRFSKTLRLGLLFETSEREDLRYYRINTKLIKRINKK